MNKQEFMSLYQEKMGLKTKKEAEKFVDGFLCTLEEVLITGENFTILGFGKFEVVTQKERSCRNPKTGEKILISSKKIVKFRVGSKLAENVNK